MADAETAEERVTSEPVKPTTGRQRRSGPASSPGKGKSKAADKPELTPELIQAATAGWERMITLGLFAAQSFIPDPIPPRPDEGDAIRGPLARVLGRHFPLPEISSDAEDYFALAIALSMYGTRVFADLASRRSSARAEPASGPAMGSTSPPRHTDQARASASPQASPREPASPHTHGHETAPVTQHAEPPGPTSTPIHGELRTPHSGEALGLEPGELVGPADEVMAKLHAITTANPNAQVAGSGNTVGPA